MKDRRETYYYCDRIPDALGRSTTGKRLHGRDGREVFVSPRTDTIRFSEDLDVRSWYTFLE